MLVLIFIGRIFSLPLIFLKYAFRRIDGPTRFRLILEELGGVYLKLGQILAMRFDLMPLQYALALLDLLDNTRPVDNPTMFQIFEKETGKKMEEMFDSVVQEPIGTASFAQVYKGWLSGQAVAIKIQKPSSAKYIKADLASLKMIAAVAGLFVSLRSVPIKEIIVQLEEWLEDELDYTIEAANNKILYEHAKRHRLENVIVPKIYTELATPKVMIQEFLSGSQAKRIIVYLETRPDDLKKILDERNIDLLKAGNAFIYDLMRQYFMDGFFHADPHPANLMIFPESKIGYVDFGIIGRSQSDNIGLLKFIKAATELDFSGCASGIIEFLDQRAQKEFGDLLMSDEKTQKTYETVLDFITRRLTEDMATIIKDWHFASGRVGLSLSERSSARAFLKIAKAVEKYVLKFPPDVIAFLRGLVIIDMVCLKLDKNFDMVKAAKIFFEHQTIEEVRLQTPEHRQETSELETLESLHLSQSAPEREEGTITRLKEKRYAAKEKLMHLVTALAEKYPELYNEIKDI